MPCFCFAPHPDRSWHFSRTGVNAFRQLAQWFEKQGSIELLTREATVLISATKWAEGVRIIERKEDRPPPRRRSRSPLRGRYSPPPRARYSPSRGRYGSPARRYDSPARYGGKRSPSPPAYRERGGAGSGRGRTPERWEMEEDDRWKG